MDRQQKKQQFIDRSVMKPFMDEKEVPLQYQDTLKALGQIIEDEESKESEPEIKEKNPTLIKEEKSIEPTKSKRSESIDKAEKVSS